jgi:hypothetical protein
MNTGPHFPPAVADRLQEPAGAVVVHVTPGGRTRRPSDYRWLLLGCHDRPVLASLLGPSRGSAQFGALCGVSAWFGR